MTFERLINQDVVQELGKKKPLQWGPQRSFAAVGRAEAQVA